MTPPTFPVINNCRIVIVILESQFHKAWNNQGVKELKAEAPQRLKREGWDPVRRALSTTIRYELFLTMPAVIQ